MGYKGVEFFALIEMNFYSSQIDGYNFNMLYVIPIVAKKIIYVKYTQQEMGRESNLVTIKKINDMQKKAKSGSYNKSYKTEINKMAIISPSLPIIK